MNELILRTGPYRTTFVGTELVRESTKEEWEGYGGILKRVDEAKQWAIGDWLVDGKRHYGDGLYQEAERVLEYHYQNLAQFKRIAELFEIKCRHLNVSYAHHYEVASLKEIEINAERMAWGKNHDMNKAQEFLNKAEKEKLSIRELRQVVQQYIVDKENEFRLANEPKKYHVIYADPPWPVGSIIVDKWESPIEDKYPTMSIENIKTLPIANLAAEQCSLFLWTTHTFLPDALDVMKIWGFKYFCLITWDKGNGWTQNGFHKKTELLLYGYKGKINIEQYGDAIPTLISETKEQHSKKPDKIRKLIEVKTIGNRLELFARETYEGWDSWGNEI